MKNHLYWRRWCAGACFFIALISAQAQPLDDIVVRRIQLEKRPLAYASIREADIFWEKRIWRVIDTREKINLPFRNPAMPLYSLLETAIREGKITPYSAEDDQFTYPLDTAQLYQQLTRADTVRIIDPITGEERWQVIRDEFNPETVVRYRLKELWYFDKQMSTLRVRILGIAPVVEKRDEFGNVKYERPLFWVSYPQCREWLSHQRAPMPDNSLGVMSWEDLLEMRMFSSYIIKESNVLDRRLDGYLAGKEMLQESKQKEQQLFNFEHDLWAH